MDRFAVMVDAGYLLRQSIEIVSQRQSTKRQHLDITDPAGLMELILSRARTALDLGARELLRVYWYDGVMSAGLTPQQRAIIDLPDVNFRAGTVNSAGQQKGVDSLLVTDLLELATNRAICDAALITGDGDLAVGIDLAQKKGVRVGVIGVEDLSVAVSHKQSFEVTSRADRIVRIGGTELNSVMRYLPPAPPAATPSTTPAQSATPVTSSASQGPNAQPAVAQGQPATSATSAAQAIQSRQVDKAAIDIAVKQFVAQQASLTGTVDKNTKRIDSAVDKALIHHVYVELNIGKLNNAEKNYARDRLRGEVGLL